MKFFRPVAIATVLAAWISGGAVAASGHLVAGNTLVYAVTLELQQHGVQHAPLREESSAASGEGTETLHIYGIGADGTAYAKVDARFEGMQDGKPVRLHGNFFAKVLPDGQIRIQGGLDRSIDEALNFANAITREVSKHSLFVGQSWGTLLQTQYVNLSVQRRVTGRKMYQQFPAAVIESMANGQLKESSDGAKASGSVTIGGTSYYDDRDHLLIGESIRMLTVVRPDRSQAQINYSATVNVVLSSLTRTAGAGGSPPSPAQSATPQAGASPTAVPAPLSGPTGYGASPASTITPRTGY